MAFDGITVSAIKAEIEDKILGGRIDKVYQPEKDEIILGIRSIDVYWHSRPTRVPEMYKEFIRRK